MDLIPISRCMPCCTARSTAPSHCCTVRSRAHLTMTHAMEHNATLDARRLGLHRGPSLHDSMGHEKEKERKKEKKKGSGSRWPDRLCVSLSKECPALHCTALGALSVIEQSAGILKGNLAPGAWRCPCRTLLLASREAFTGTRLDWTGPYRTQRCGLPLLRLDAPLHPPPRFCLQTERVAEHRVSS